MKKRKTNEQLLLNEIQLLLAEKRTYYALLRTGVAIFTLPIPLLAILLATNEYHRIFFNAWIACTILGFLITISLVGLSLFYKAEKKVKRLDRMIRLIEKENKRIAEILI